MNWKWLRNILWILLLAGMVAAVLVLRLSPFWALTSNLEGLQDWIADAAPYSNLAYFGIQLLAVIVAPIPNNIVAMAGGAIFGMWPSFIITILAVVTGSSITFTLARLLGQRWVENFVNRKISTRYLDAFRSRRDTLLFLTLLFPFFPDDIICILAGLTDISFRRYILIVLFARPWGLLAASLLGSSAIDLSAYALALVVALIAVCFWVGLKYGRKFEDWMLKKLGRGK